MQKAFFSIIILLLLFQLSAFCQKQDVGHVCANDLVQYAPYPKNSATLRTKNFGAVGGINYVPIQLHVLRRNDGSTSFDWSRFLKSFENLNKIFAEIDVQFYLITSVNYINNTDFYDFNADFEENDMCNANDASNAVNLYLTNSIIFGYGFNATGYAYYPSPIAASNRIFLTNSAINTGTRTLVHEFGHYFNLLHTFQDNNNPQLTKRELVTRGFGANCSVAGDFVCDTPADPFGLTGATYNGCIYSGNTTDANGMLYSPDLTNTMSYYSESCGSDFSTGQFVRMQEGYTFRNSPENEYNLNFVDQGVTAPSNLVVSATSAGIAINFTDNATNELGYLIERATAAAGPFEPVGSVSANIVSYVDQSVLSNTIFYYRVRALNGIGYSNVGQAATGTFYCQPIYQQSCASFPVVMEQFSIAGTALRNINSGCSPNNYGKFTNMVAELEKGKSYTFTASATTTANVPYYAQYLTLWIDFNQDGFFESNEIVYKSTSSSGMNPSVSSLISIPNTAVDGFTMLRARTQYFSFGEVADPCKELVMGETEDYVVNITSPAANSLINIQFVSPLTVCRGNTVSLNFSTSGGGFSSSTRYVVQIDDRNGQFFNLPTQMTSTGTLLATIPLSFATGSGFSVRVVAENPQVTSPIAAEKLTIIAVPPSPTLTINQPSANVCIGSSVSINAVGCAGIVTWSDNFVGNPYTFLANKDVTLAANCTVNGCTGNFSTPISITTKSLPAPPQISSAKNVYCAGETVTLNAASCSGTVTWSNGSTGSLVSFTASSTLTLSATCRINGCESNASAPFALTVNSKPAPPQISSAKNVYCAGETVTLNATSCSGTVTWSNGSTGSSVSFTASSTLTLSATCRVNGCESNASAPFALTVNSKPAPPQISSARNVYCAGETVTLNATSCSGTVTWSNGSTGSSVSFTASSSLTLSATCRVNGCESNASAPFALTVNSKPAPPQISSAKNVYCAGETVTLNATSCSGTVTWSNGSTGSSVSFTASSTLTLSATCLINGCESNASAPFALTVNSKPAPPLISIEDGSLNHCSGEKVTLNAANCFGTVNWNNGVAGSSVAVMVQTDTAYFATCTVNNCVSEKSADILFNCVPLESKVKRVTINLRVILEGPYNANAELMSTTYNDRGLLPGQEPTSQFGLPTPSGQPYNRIPWDYAGSESVIDYAGTVVDWVLVSLKSDERTVIYQTAALLHADARIEFIEEFPELDTTNAYFVQIDHRNHVGAMSSEKIPILDNRISHNFTTTNSYVKPNTPAFGQKRIGNKYVLFVGDIEKGSVSQHYDINFADITKLRSSIGLFERYIDADLNLDADINFNDLIMWRENSGRFSSVTL